ncbi:MAG TPA: FAD-linked oxidase C-terminal domain-containing protein [Pyrinomonadaceae bacterium]
MDQLVQDLRAIVGADGVINEPAELLVYECDGLTQHKHRPRAVVFPTSTDEAAAVVKELARAGVSFAPRGAGTGLSGGALALDQGVVIELARMRRVLKVEPENRLAIVEAGLVNAQLSRAVAAHGLHYVPDPSSGASCTIGGNIAENAGGIHCLKYGTTTDHVLAARVVLSDGTVIDLGGAGAEAPGYDLLGVFVGAEGTFGIATEATVRLVPLPPAVRTLLADFADVNAASRAVSAIIAAGLVPAALEMLDGATIRAVEASVFAAGLPPDAEAALLIELDGLEAGLDDEAAQAEAICRAHGARHVRRAADEAERKKLWAARKGAFGAMGRLAPDLMLQDAVVPRSRLPEVLADIYRIGAHYHLRLANVFHAGDGNLHPLICFDLRDADEVRRVEAASHEIVETCVRAGGTITGEHGVGLDKKAYLPLIFSADDLATMLQVRAAFDPSGLCNPGKIIPAPRGCGEARAARAGTRRANGNAADAQPAAFVAAARQQPFAASGTPNRSQPAPLRAAFAPERAHRQLAALVGAEHVAAAQDAVTVAPASAEEACEIMRLCAHDGWPVVPAGAATWLDAGQSCTSTRVIINTRRMARLIRHEPADLVATAEAGLTFAAFNEATGRAGQWLPIDPPDDGRATIGGVIATGLGGAHGFSQGLPRGYVLGLRVVLADGRYIKAGGHVVKNVAGYDLCKLFTGSYGTLGLITELTCKLRPRPAHMTTMVVRAASGDTLLDGARRLRAGDFLPVALELLGPALAARLGLDAPHGQSALLVRFASKEATVVDQVRRARSLFARADALELITADAPLWQALAAEPCRASYQLGWRASVKPTDLPALIAALRVEHEGDATLCWHAGLGDGRVRVMQAAAESAAQVTARLVRVRRTAETLGGVLVVERAPTEVRQKIDAWGVRAAPAQLMRRIKQQLDPAGLLAPGRFF